MSILQIGVTLGAIVFVVIFIGATIATIVSFIQAQTMLLKASFTGGFKNPYASYHPFTQQILSGQSPELKLAQQALKNGDRAEAHRLVDEIVFLLNAEPNTSIRKQLQSKLKKAL